MITSTAELKKLAAHAKSLSAIALDTEFFWERTYYPQLGLIQLALSNEECYLIDPLAIDDLSPLGELLTDRGVVKIFHDAAQDLAILHRATGVAAQNIFDTRLAAGFASLPSTLSLANLIKSLLDIDIPKTETRTNWLQRPLTPEQVEYAKDDVRYLQAVRLLLQSRIIGPKIRAWLQEELNLLNNPQNYLPNSSDRHLKFRGASALKRPALALLKTLCDWREETAKNSNKARGHILPDGQLVELATKAPASLEELRALGLLSGRAFDRYGRQIITLCQETMAAPEKVKVAVPRQLRLSTRENDTYQRVQNLIHLKCDILGIDPALIGNSSELKAVARILNDGKAPANGALRQLDGWRANILEDFFHQNR